MADASRNFRSYYYDKVGFRGVEEKKSLEILLKEKPLDKTKLSNFCQRFTVPSMYREYVWKVLLGVISVNPDSHKSVMYQREEHYNDLRHALEVMRKINVHTSEPVVFTLMFLLGQGLLLFDLQQQMEDEYTQNLIALASVFIRISTSEMNGYWMFRNFVLSQKKNPPCFTSLHEQLESVLKKEDPELFGHLIAIKAMNVLPTQIWFERYFAEILHESALERVWDKVIGGSCKIMAFVGAAMLMTLRRSLLELSKPEEVVTFLQKIPEDTSDVVVNKALDLCYSMK